jgi:hypothetical protein
LCSISSARGKWRSGYPIGKGLFFGWKKPARSFADFRFRSRDLDAPVVSRWIKKRDHFSSNHCCALLRKKQSEMADLATFVLDWEYLK